MPCDHKFKKHLYLKTLDDFEPTKLIVGTFNPLWPSNNEAEWFYGRTNNNYFWDILPRLFNENSLIDGNPDDWKLFCKRNKIAITDLISCIKIPDENNQEHVKNLKGFSDSSITKNFHQFDFVDIVELLIKFNTITNVYFTRSADDPFWKKRWEPVMKYCNENGKKCDTLLTPSSNARFQKKNHDKNKDLKDFILSRWEKEWFEK
jgi:hypothetical protein